MYADIPHLLAPVVTDPKVASNVLRNATREMERRLKLLAQRGVRNIDQYNRTFAKGQSLSLFENVEEEEHKPLPLIVIVIDELADLMMVDTNNVEESITRLAQMARAVGIHLILATQRPSVDVITGLIKANFPARISFRVASKVDSRTILDANGAESLLGKRRHAVLAGGIFAAAPHSRPDGERRGDRSAVRFLALAGQSRLQPAAARSSQGGAVMRRRRRPERARRKWTTHFTRRPCAWSARWAAPPLPRCSGGCASAMAAPRGLIDIMEKDGIVGPADGTKPREVLKKKDWMREFDESVK